MTKNFYEFKAAHVFIVIMLFYLAITILTYKLVFSDSFFYNLLSNKFEFDSISEIIIFQRKSEQIRLFLIPVFLVLKILIISGSIFIAITLLDDEVSFLNTMKIALLAEFVFIVSELVKLTWLIVDTPTTAESLRFFSPLCITQLIDIRNIPNYLVYPLKMFNVFEVTYWLCLAYGIMSLTTESFRKSLKIVASSYGVALLIWVIFVVFLQVQFT